MSIFLAGAGAPGPNQPGKDGNPKCPPEARVFALQVVDALLGDKSKVDGLPVEQKQAVEQAFLQFVETEYVEGTAEAGPGTWMRPDRRTLILRSSYRTRANISTPTRRTRAVQSLMRNKLAHSLALLFIALYPSLQTPMQPSSTPSLLGPYLSLLKPTRNSQTSLLLLRTLVEINEEVHDTLLKSARPATADRSERDNKLRDEVREKEAATLHGTVVAVWEEALGRLDGGEGAGWTEVVEGAVKAYSGYVRAYDTTYAPLALLVRRVLISPASSLQPGLTSRSRLRRTRSSCLTGYSNTPTSPSGYSRSTRSRASSSRE